MSVSFCGLELAHPVINASGTFDAIAARTVFGEALYAEFPFSAFVSKTITLEARHGNPPPRLWEAPGGLVNSIGLPNKGLESYLANDLPLLAQLPVPLITNVMGSTAAEIASLLERCERPEIAAIELNVSCPNVKTGLDIGADPATLAEVVRAVRPRSSKPLIVKLTPNTADVALCARGAQEGGADAVSLINTLRATALTPGVASRGGGGRTGGRGPDGGEPADGRERAGGGASTHDGHGERHVDSAATGAGRVRWLGGGTGGLSGPAIRAVALAQVAAVAAAVAIPVVGMGGVQSAAHARDLLDVGATLVAVGTESFRDPTAGARIARELAL
jgi:dihydroorotate dehydrogenase (NAD+) catalytic subunit